MKLKLSARISLLVAVVLFVIMVTGGIVLQNYNQKMAVQESQRSINEVSAIISQAIAVAMRSGETDGGQVCNQFMDNPNIKELVLIPGPSLDESYTASSHNQLIRRAMETATPQENFELLSTTGLAKIATPLVADNSCLDCHEVKKGAALGVISLSYSVKDLIASQNQMQAGLWWFAAFVVILTTVVISIVLSKNVVKPVKSIISNLELLSKGKSIDIELRESGDEIYQAEKALSLLSRNLMQKAAVADQISKGNF
ncbi:MAG: hypothetical protein Kow0037_01860 [Calditrichia bacterium]